MLGHRFQILLDDERYERVRQLAQERRMSTAAVIREAIDRGLPTSAPSRAAAGRRILEAPEMPVPEDPCDLRDELDDLRGRRG